MDDPRIDPADLRNARFPGSSRRYDAKAVDQFLRSIAERVVATNALVDDLTDRVAEAEADAAAEQVATERPDLSTLDDDELVQLVGEETTSVLSAARRAAEDIRSKAEESASRVIREATDEAKRLVDEAKDRVVELTADAEAAHERAVTAAEADAERIRQDAERDAHRLLAEAREESRTLRESVEAERDEARDEAARVLVEAREEGRSMVAEAKEVRGRILEDLQRRRDAARAQIERLHAGREELLGLYARIRDQVDEVTGRLGDDASEDDALDSVEVPELPDGFVGVVGAETESPEVDAQADGGTDRGGDTDVEPDSDGAADGDHGAGVEEVVDRGYADDGYVDDTVAPPVEHEFVPTPPPAADRAPEPEPTGEPGEAGEAGADVDALFARLRAEREQSVARAHEVLDEPNEAVEPETVPEEAEASEELADDVEAAEAEPAEGGAPTAADSEVDRVPDEFLAPHGLLEARADVIDALDTALARRIKRHLADEQNEVLDLLRRTGSTTVDDLLPDADAHVGAYARLTAVDLAGAATAGAASVEASAAPPDVTELAHELGATLVEPFRRRLERASAELGGDADELDERLRALYREWKVQHIGPAVADALLSAYARGIHAAAPEGAPMRWLIDPAQGPCPDAQDNALAGTVAKGEAFPTGDECPQAHPGCRCLLVVDES